MLREYAGFFFQGTWNIQGWSKDEEYLYGPDVQKHGPQKMQGELNYSSIPEKLLRGSGLTIWSHKQ